jgi:hypothetical protein
MASSFDAVPGVSHVEVAGEELTLHVDGPVTAVLARAADLGAIGIRTVQRELDDIFLETYASEPGR